MPHRFNNTLSAQKDVEIDVTPMLDVIFILLIFFIVTATFVRERGLNLVKNEDTTTVAQQETKPLLVEIKGDNSIWIGSQAIDKRLISARILNHRSTYPKSQVLVAPYEGSNNQRLVWVLDAARQAGVSSPKLVELE